MKECAITIVGKHCTGCEACVQCCPHHALTMEPDGEGFFYPVLREDLCTRCGLCAAICPAASPERVPRTALPDTALAGTYREKSTLLSSASGGAFSAVVAAAGPDVVYGTAWTAPDTAACIRVTPETMEPLRSSKYIQGRIHNAYLQVKQDLAEGRRVLFSGTPCQVAGLLTLLGERPAGLTTVEIVCHGTASPGLFRDYLASLGQEAGSPVRSFTFRKKSALLGNWEAFRREARFENGKTDRTYQDPFTRLFLSRTILRPSCGNCSFAAPERVSDLVIGDYWGCGQNDPALYNKGGVSIILPVTERGREVAAGLAAYMEVSTIPTDHVTAHNRILLCPQSAGADRAAFFERASREGTAATIAAFPPKPSWKQPLKPYLRLFLKRLRG